jgi:outer membrane protein TolC
MEANVKRCIVVFLIVFSFFCGVPVFGEEVDQPVSPDLSGITVLNLETAQELALAGNPSMDAAFTRVEQARARVSQAVAAWWPTLDLTATGSKIRRSDQDFAIAQFFPSIAGQSTDRVYDQGAAGLQVSWILFDGFYRSFKHEQAKYGEKSVEAARRDAQRLLLSAVAEAFLNAQLAQTNVKIARADMDFYSQQLRDAENRFEVGAGPWGDVLNIKVQLNSAKTNLLLNRRQFEAAGYGLAALLGLQDAVLPDHVSLAELDLDFDVSRTEDTPDQLISEALELRPDIRQMVMRVKEAEAGAGMAKAPYYPKVQLAGAYNGARQGDVSLTGEDFGNSISLNLSWNLFSGGLDRARRFEAEQGHREAKFTLADLRNQVVSQVRQDMALLEAAREQVILQRESVTFVEENRDLAKNEYDAGETSLVRLNEAQRDLTTTYSRLTQSLVAFHRARQRLLTSTGRNIAQFVADTTEVETTTQ